MESPLVPVIMAGGTGTRLWPLSREQFPKQFIALTDPSSLLQVTARRAQRLNGATAPLAICGEDQRFLVGEQLRGCGVPAEVLIEPVGRNTAPAAACAALQAQRRHGEQALVLLMAADHVIADEAAFVQAVDTAVPVARAGRIVVFGIRPTRPETGYGYLRIGAARGDGAHELTRFVEKPDRATAEAFLADGNAVRGDTWLHNARNNLVHAGSRLVALAGVSDTIVVETQDAVLVTTREHAQDVKKIVARLKAEGRSEAVHHPTVFRPWGSYETVAMDERFQVKRIVVKPGQKLSLQMHHHRAEHWIVVKGTAEITIGEKVFMLSENQSTYIPLGEKHRLVNPGKLPLELIEVQSGSYLGEDDIVRFDDLYGRSPEKK